MEVKNLKIGPKFIGFQCSLQLKKKLKNKKNIFWYISEDLKSL